MRTLRSIVIGIDFSDTSRVALEHAVRIAGWSGVALLVRGLRDAGKDPTQQSVVDAINKITDWTPPLHPGGFCLPGINNRYRFVEFEEQQTNRDVNRRSLPE